MKAPCQIALLAILSLNFLVGCNRGSSSQTSLTEPVSAQTTVSTDGHSSSTDAAVATQVSEPTMLPGPNAVPSDTRIIVNIPAFRMDMFRDGTLLKSYKIGIGYVQYPLPRGLRKAEMIIFKDRKSVV